MIRRIELVNFMSHRHSIIDLAEGLTVLVGPNNCGKSAVVTALKILAHNEPSTFVKRHGAKDCQVKIDLVDDDGTPHTIEWGRKTSPSYKIDGQIFDRLRNAGPPPLLDELLKLQKVIGEGENIFDIHFGEQKSPVFLLDKSPGQTAQFFASSSDAAHLVAMQKLHGRQIQEAKSAVQALDQIIKRTGDEVEKLAGIDDLHQQIEFISGEGEKLRNANGRFGLIKQLRADLLHRSNVVRRLNESKSCLNQILPPPRLQDIAPLANQVAAIRNALENLGGLSKKRQSLGSVVAPPPVIDLEPVKNWIGRFVSQRNKLAALQIQKRTTEKLQTPPVLKNGRDLEQRLTLLRSALHSLSRYIRHSNALAKLPELPTLHPAQPLHQMRLGMIAGLAECDRLRKEALQIDIDIEEILNEWNTLRREQPGCPTCGQELPDDLPSTHRHDAVHRSQPAPTVARSRSVDQKPIGNSSNPEARSWD